MFVNEYGVDAALVCIWCFMFYVLFYVMCFKPLAEHFPMACNKRSKKHMLKNSEISKQIKDAKATHESVFYIACLLYTSDAADE